MWQRISQKPPREVRLLTFASALCGYCWHDGLVSAEDVSGIYFVLDVVETLVVTIGDNGLTLSLECIEIVDDPAAKECASVLEGRLIDYDLGTFGLNPFHDTLNAALAEVVGV